MPTVHVNDIDIYYEIHGEGEPLLNILGASMNIAAFSMPKMIRLLAKHYKVIAFDHRGMGRSSNPDTPYNMETLARDTLGLMDALDIRKAHIVGGSMGGCVAQLIAAEHPERVNGLVLHGTACRYALRMRILVGLIVNIPFLRRRSIKMADMIFKEPYPPTEDSYLFQTTMGVGFDCRHLLGRITAPTLVIGMTHDQFVPMKFTRELAEGIRGSQLEWIEGDHLFLFTEPERVTRPMLKFLAEVDAKTAEKMKNR